MKAIHCKLMFLSIALVWAVEASAQNNAINLPEPYATPSVMNFSKVIGWPEGKTPTAPAGFRVTEFARNFDNPRWIYVAPGGRDIFVSDASSGTVYLFRDTDHNGTYKTRYIYLTRLNRPFGMLILDGYFYVANTDGLLRFPYDPRNTEITDRGEKLLGFQTGRHWTRNLIANREGTKIYVAVGSASNIGENGMDQEIRRANILEINPDGSGEIVYASGLRNPVGMDWNPANGELWTAVNERDGLGDDLVPDYATHVRKGGFYGWPYSYFGAHEDPRIKGKKRPDLVAEAIVPDVPLGAHTASLGLAFYTGRMFPEKYRNGMFIAQHGSWNRSELAGYKVVFIPFKNGKPSGRPEDFLTGFIANADKNQVYGRPVCVAVLPDGSLLVTDDASKVIWRVTVDK